MNKTFAIALLALSMGLTVPMRAADPFAIAAIPVKDVDQPARNGIQVEYQSYLPITSHNQVTFITDSHVIYTVPAGKQLVVETFNMRCDKPIALAAMSTYRDSSGNSAGRAIAMATPVNTEFGSFAYAQTKLYAGPGATVSVNGVIGNTLAQSICVAGFSGYLVNAQ